MDSKDISYIIGHAIGLVLVGIFYVLIAAAPFIIVIWAGLKILQSAGVL